uniref:MFS-type drug efflux transporter P55 n=1 Tax=uncultured bacterium contig00009 TaxID=1181501 RepID=A0A806JZV3_9BACT|nr:drug resistance transporter, EmrB/QacA subfamily [uncultured bacterium contig00009]
MVAKALQNAPAGKSRAVVAGIVTVFLTYFTYSYFFQILLAALPRITADLDGMHLYAWAVSIPNLGLAFSMLLVGKFSDMFGRRALLIVALSICLIGAAWSALSASYLMLIVSRTFLSIGQGALAPLCFAAFGDMFESGERSKWVGMLNIPSGIFASVGPALGGWFTDALSWRYIFWCGVPLLVLSLLMAVFAMPRHKLSASPAIDGPGALLAAAASSTLILAFSMAGTMYPWGSPVIIGLFVVSAIFWFWFIRTEAKAKEPILDLRVLKNRVFIIITVAGLLSSFGLAGLMVYYPLLVQGIQGASATENGWIMTPGNFLMYFLGFPAGFILARVRKYKWMFLSGYGLTAAVILFLVSFNASTPLFWGFCVFTLAGIGMGSIPTLNTLVAQYAVPRRLLGVATGALYFSVMLGQAIAPAVLGSAMNMKYTSALAANLPSEVESISDKELLTSLGNPRVLLSEPAMAALSNTLGNSGPDGPVILERTIEAIRLAMEAGLKVIFIIGAIAMTLTFLIICLLPSLSIDTPPPAD